MSNLKFFDPTTQKVFDSSMWETQQNFLDISTGNGAINGGGDSNTVMSQLLRRVSPWMSKATDMTALAVSELPFDILDENGEIVDSSSDWQNEIGGMESPEDLIYLLASSLCNGKAYLIPTYLSGRVLGLQYCAPNTVIPNITTNGLIDFNRSTNTGMSGRFVPADGETDNSGKELMYFWLPDSDIECGPAQTYPSGVALAACGLLTAMDGTIKMMSERGFITPTVLMASGNPGKDQRRELESEWSRFVRGFTNFVTKVFNGDKLTVQKVGAELDEIAAAYPPLSKQAIENIGTAYGIPAQIYMADMAFASEVDPIIKVWYSTSVFRKIYHTIEKTFNNQLLKRFGLRMKFKPETLSAFQDKKTDPSGAWKTYVDGGADPIGVAKMVGIVVPDGLTYEEIFPPKPEPNPVPEQLKPFAGVNNPPAQPDTNAHDTTNEADQPQPGEGEGVPMNADTVKALDLWRQVAVRNFKKGKTLPVDFKVEALPADVADRIRGVLKVAASEDEVIKAFEVRTTVQPVDQIKRALDWLEMHERV